MLGGKGFWVWGLVLNPASTWEKHLGHGASTSPGAPRRRGRHGRGGALSLLGDPRRQNRYQKATVHSIWDPKP